MISKTEIKKCKFKPVLEHPLIGDTLFESVKDDIKMIYSRSIPGGKAFIYLYEEELLLFKWQEEDNEMIIHFRGKLPARYELQIILRCTGIA
jgi:hypothetical protein